MFVQKDTQKEHSSSLSLSLGIPNNLPNKFSIVSDIPDMSIMMTAIVVSISKFKSTIV